MALTDSNRLSIAFKKLQGKAQTQQGFAFFEESISTNVSIASSTIFGELINSNPVSDASLTSLYDTDGIVEKVRFEIDIIGGTAIGTNQSQGYQLKLPSDYTINGVLGGIYSGGTYLHEALGRLQIVPSLYGELKPDNTTEYDPALYETNGSTIIPKFDSIDWILDPYNGVLFVQDPPPGFDVNAGRPGFLEAYLYVGDYLSDITLTGGTGGGGGPAEKIERTFTQPSHGFSVGDVVAYSGGTYIKATANIDEDFEVIGFIDEIIDANNFNVVFAGYVDTISGLGLSADTTYYLSDTVAGAITADEPSLIGAISKPILLTTSTSAGLVVQYRGIEIQAPLTRETKIITTNYTVTNDDSYIGVSGSSITVDLPAVPTVGLEITVADVAGTALSSNVTIDGNGNNIIDDTTALIDTDYGSITFLYTGNKWSVIAFSS